MRPQAAQVVEHLDQARSRRIHDLAAAGGQPLLDLAHGGCVVAVACNKWPGETQREWGRTITMDADVQQRMDGVFAGLSL